MKPSVSFCILAGLALSTASGAAEHNALKAFPPAEEGMKRMVIELPHKERDEEGGFKVELVAGKLMETDGVNRFRLGSNLTPEPLKGWGYTLYRVKGSDQVAGTLMAPPPGTPKKKQFVSGEPLLIPYNSRLPIVVYAPAGYEIRFRIWQAPEEMSVAEEG